MEVHTMRPAPLRPPAAPADKQQPAQPSRYLTNDEAADYLRLSPRTLEKQRVIGGGPRFRKFGRRVMYAMSDLDAWADARSFEATSDPEYANGHAGDSRNDR
ncbi:MAG: helix-turn-helix domain-containing protein [Gammaproteobacteria bacterium]|nr:helix-turn-helix domain-containing protein [Gammaproteobacteria bacterium]